MNIKRTSVLLLNGEIDACCDAEPQGVPCPCCGKSSLMHAVKKAVSAARQHQAELSDLAWRRRLDHAAEDFNREIVRVLDHYASKVAKQVFRSVMKFGSGTSSLSEASGNNAQEQRAEIIGAPDRSEDEQG